MNTDPKTLSADSSLPSEHEDDEKPQGGLLSRWSARKTAVAQSETAEAEARIEAKRLEEAQPEIEAQEAENRKIAEAIDIDVADYETDFTPFLKDGVPAALRRRAMRAMWRTNPILANVDGLNDYDEDFRIVEGAFETVKSTWEVGRGYAGKAKEVSQEMKSRDEEIRKAIEAEKDSPLGGDDDNLEEADVANTIQELDDKEIRDDTRETLTQNPDISAQADTAEDQPPQPAPPSQRASLRHRLLQNQD